MKFLCMLVAAMPVLSAVAAAEDTRCFELRTYHANPGKLDALHARFRDHTIKLFEKHGFTNIGYWVPKNNSDSQSSKSSRGSQGSQDSQSSRGNRLIYVIASPDLAANRASWKGFLGDADWKAAYKKSVADGRLVGKIDSVFLTATDYSPEIKPDAREEPRLFELRTYTTNEGKLKGLNARFRDHTTRLFKKHGLHQFAYWTPMKEEDGRDNKLIYILAHQDEVGRGVGFKNFGADPDWKSARKASEENGKLLSKRPDFEFLIPTDYSPTK